MLRVKPRGGGRRRYQYNGSGIFDSLAKHLASKGIKSAINTAAKSAVAQKVANAIVNGASSAAEKATKDLVNEAVNGIKKIGRKRVATVPANPIESKVQTVETLPREDGKRAKVNINHLINGRGIVFD